MTAASGRPTRLLMVSSSLGRGGADRQILKIAELLQGGYVIKVVSLIRLGHMGVEAGERGIDVEGLSAVRGFSSRIAVRLALVARRWRPDLIQGWMYHGNLAATVAGLLAPGRVPALWGVRHSLYGLDNEPRLTQHVVRLSAHVSRTTAGVIYNAVTSVEQHEQIGFDARKSIVIPNGFDCDVYRHRPEAKARLCADLGIPSSALVVGVIARFHPQKDHATLIRAVSSLAAKVPDLHLVLIGGSVDNSNGSLMALLQENGLAGRVSLLGGRMDVPDLVAGFDIAVLSSAWGEGFPNVVGEAMASEVPCVVTDVGDSARIVGDTGVVVPPRDPAALAAGLKRLADLGPDARKRLGQAARASIVERFSLTSIAEQYTNVYRRAIGNT